MKTLADVIEEIDAEVDARFDFEDTKLMRRVCETMEKEIVPDENKYCPDVDHICYEQGYNDCRDEILNKIKDFMGEKK